MGNHALHLPVRGGELHYLAKGIIGGIERSVKYLMPLLFIFLIGMVIRNLTLPGAMEGVTFYLKPDFSKITP